MYSGDGLTIAMGQRSITSYYSRICSRRVKNIKYLEIEFSKVTSRQVADYKNHGSA